MDINKHYNTAVDDPLKKMNGESDYSYHKRLVNGKLIDRTLADYDYSELAECVYGKPYSTDVARRMMYGSQKTIELVDKLRLEECVENNSDNYGDIISEIETQKLELQKERQRFSDQRREYNKLVNKDARLEYLYEKLLEIANSLPNDIGHVYTGDFREIELEDTDAVLVFSDWHYGMTADNIYNTYNTDICKQRVKAVTEKATEKICMHRCTNLHVVVLGDLIHGSIHAGTRVASEELTCEEIMHSAEILAQSIEYLSGCVKNVFVYTTYGNHARTIQNKDDSIHRDNMERLIRWWLEQRFKEHDDIAIMDESSNEFIKFAVKGHWFCASHGDLDSVKSSPRLLYTLLQKTDGIDLEYVLLGDKHHTESFDELGIHSEICGSLCGTDEYANNKRLYSTPSQLLLIVNKDDGVDAEYKIKC